MALFPSSGVPAATYVEYAFLSRYAGAVNPCAALLTEKNAHFWIGNSSVPNIYGLTLIEVLTPKNYKGR